jgi:hypothetical protein
MNTHTDTVRRYPLDVLVVAGHMHAGAGTTMGLMEQLRENPAVRACGANEDEDTVMGLIRQGAVNTVFVDPQFLFWDAAPFIDRVRKEFPRVVFVIYANDYCLGLFCKAHERFKNYFYLDHITTMYHAEQWSKTGSRVYLSDAAKQLDLVLKKCENWHAQLFRYDIALSFAGDDRKTAQKLARALKKRNMRVFYDEDQQAELLGKNLYTHLYDVYAHQSRYCVILASKAYVEKAWTNHERAAAQERAFKERGSDYVIPVRIDDAPIPALPTTVAYVRIEEGVTRIADLLQQKLWLTDSFTSKGIIGPSRI